MYAGRCSGLKWVAYLTEQLHEVAIMHPRMMYACLSVCSPTQDLTWAASHPAVQDQLPQIVISTG